MALAASIIAVVAVGGVAHVFFYDQTQLALMKFFRDVSRSKAHARLHGRSAALAMVLTGTEELLPIPAVAEDGISLTAEELKKFDGTNGSPLYLGIMGR